MKKIILLVAIFIMLAAGASAAELSVFSGIPEMSVKTGITVPGNFGRVYADGVSKVEIPAETGRIYAHLNSKARKLPSDLKEYTYLVCEAEFTTDENIQSMYLQTTSSNKVGNAIQRSNWKSDGWNKAVFVCTINQAATTDTILYISNIKTYMNGVLVDNLDLAAGKFNLTKELQNLDMRIAYDKTAYNAYASVTEKFTATVYSSQLVMYACDAAPVIKSAPRLTDSYRDGVVVASSGMSASALDGADGADVHAFTDNTFSSEMSPSQSLSSSSVIAVQKDGLFSYYTVLMDDTGMYPVHNDNNAQVYNQAVTTNSVSGICGKEESDESLCITVSENANGLWGLTQTVPYLLRYFEADFEILPGSISAARFTTDDGKPLSSDFCGWNADSWNTVSFVYDFKMHSSRVYVNGKQVAANSFDALTDNFYKTDDDSVFRLILLNTTGTEAANVYIDDMNVFLVDDSHKVQDLWDSTFSNDYGDYLYFDSKQLNNETGKYNNLTYSDNANYIEQSRLDYKEKDRTDWIYLERSTAEECYINVNLQKSSTSKSGKKYKYFLFEADVKSDILGSTINLYKINSALNAVTIAPDGEILLCAEHSGSFLAEGSQHKISLAVNLIDSTLQLYVDGEAVKSAAIGSVSAVSTVKTELTQNYGNLFLDNYRITGLENPFGPGYKKSDIFGEYAEQKAFLNEKVAFSAYGSYYYANENHVRLMQKPIYSDGELYVALEDFNSAFSLNLQSNPDFMTENGIIYVPLKNYATNELGKHVSVSEKTGLFVIADAPSYISDYEWDYLSFRNITRMTILNNLDLLNNFVMYPHPDATKLRNDAVAELGSLDVHPRLMLTNEKLNAIKARAQSDADFNRLLNRYIETAKKKLDTSIAAFEFNDTTRMNVGSTLEYIMMWGIAYNLTGEQRYVDKAWLTLKSVAEFPDYNLASILNSSEFNEILAIGYDWLYNGLTAQQREFLKNTILRKSLAPLADGYYGRIFARGDDWSTLKWSTNMNAVSNGGAIIAAAAVAESSPDSCFDTISKALRSLDYTMMCFAPDGSWIEGTSYWNYACTHLGYSLLSLKSMFGEYYGIDATQGFEKTCTATLSAIGPCGINSVGDSSVVSNASYPSFGMISEITGNSLLGEVRSADLLANTSKAVSTADILTYNHTTGAAIAGDKVTVLQGSETFTIRNDYSPQSQNLYFTTHFGKTSGYHLHNDTGTFVLDLLGERWAEDLGKDDYNLENELGYAGWQLYRKRAEGHNVMVINPPSNSFEQITEQYVPIEKYSSNPAGGFVCADMSNVYADVDAMKLGYYIGDDMRSVTVRYELTPNKDSEIYWFMHTKADITVNGNTAYLTKNGKKIFLSFETTGTDALLSMTDAKPLASSPQTPEQEPNEGYSKIQIKINALKDSNVNLTVKIAPINEGISETEIMDTPISQWQN